ncbi:hypothetical protein RB597_000806 [Gaeumannomyces tritici]
METTLGPCEAIVSSTHGNAALSDAAHPVAIAHHPQGAVLTPPPAPQSSTSTAAVVTVGKVHFPLPMLRSPENETVGGSLSAGLAIVSTALEVAVAPYQQPSHDGQPPPPLLLHGRSKVTGAAVFAGRKLLWSTGRGGEDDLKGSGGRERQHQQGPLPTDRDFKAHIESVIYGGKDGEMRFNESRQGLGVTLMVEFQGERPGLMVSSVALVQIMGSRRPPA